jgi:hypothetical protein
MLIPDLASSCGMRTKDCIERDSSIFGAMTTAMSKNWSRRAECKQLTTVRGYRFNAYKIVVNHRINFI